MNVKEKKVFCTFENAPLHRFPGHPESPQRLDAIAAWLENPPYREIEWLDFDAADEAEVMLVHRPAHLDFLKEASRQGAHQFESAPSYVTQSSYRSALDAVGGTLAVSRRIITEGSGSGFAIIRPPGHHAGTETAMGFCLLNNLAIAAADAVASGLSPVAIVDFDAHHGNGTQAVFQDTPEVAFFSMHEANIYPGTGQIASAPHARGRIINAPLPSFTGTRPIIALFEQVVKPWLASVQPEILFVSAGYDAHFSDPLTTLTVDTSGYFKLTQLLMEWAETFCHGRIIFVLEGGYDTLALQDNLQATLAALSGNNNFPDHYGSAPRVRQEIDSVITEIKNFHQL